MNSNCLLCDHLKADKRFNRVEIWKNDLWRLTLSRYTELNGFCYLEPIRHITDISQLDGPEAQTFGLILPRISKLLKNITKATLVYIYIFGDHNPHLHIHLAPHFDDDQLYEDILKPDVDLIKAEDYPIIPEALEPVADYLKVHLDQENEIPSN